MKTLFNTSRYIPEDSIETKYEHVNAVTYLAQRDNGQLRAAGYSGRRNKPDFNGYFNNQQEADNYIANWLKRLEAQIAYRKEALAERHAYNHTLKVGDILNSSWGYDQTNVDFYEVVEVKSKKTVVIQKIKRSIVEASQSLHDYSHCIPCPGEYCGELLLKRVSRGNNVRIEQSYML